jgi:hypothetical protein
MELQDKVIRFGRIAEEAVAFRTLVWNRFKLAGSWRLLADSKFRKNVLPHVSFRQDLFQIDMPKEAAVYLKELMTQDEQASPYASIILARFPLTALAQYTLETLALTIDDLDAIEEILNARVSSANDPMFRNAVILSTGLLSWIATSIPGEVLTALHLDKDKFIPIAYLVGVSAVATTLLWYLMNAVMMSRLKAQSLLTSELIAYCRANLKTVGPKDEPPAENTR